MQTPPYLNPGDQLTIISTARKISEAELEPARALIESWGFKVKFSPYLFEECHQFAGSADVRIKALQEAIDDENCKAILCARGGYGTVQIIDHIDFSKFQKQPKWIIGYSDVTVLHTYLQEVLGIESVHATMPINFPKNGQSNESTDALRKVLMGEKVEYEFKHGSNSANAFGQVKGKLIGGNLSILYSLTGTINQVDTRGNVLFFEDLDEYLYHIDRMMMNLKRAKMLDFCAGILVGGMSDMNDNTIPFGQTAEEIILENTKTYSYPVIFDFPAGHVSTNLALIMGREVELHIEDQKSRLIFNG